MLLCMHRSWRLICLTVWLPRRRQRCRSACWAPTRPSSPRPRHSWRAWRASCRWRRASCTGRPRTPLSRPPLRRCRAARSTSECALPGRCPSREGALRCGLKGRTGRDLSQWHTFPPHPLPRSRRYGPTEGLPELREALLRKLQQENKLEGVDVMVTAGANQVGASHPLRRWMACELPAP